MIDNIFDQLKRDEGIRLKPYLDCCGKYWRECTCASKGKLTIGIGRNLDDVGISNAEADYLEQNDVDKVIKGIHDRLPWASELDLPRFGVLQNMAFNMGVAGLLKFPAMLSKLRLGLFEDAAGEMIASAWYGQVGSRALRLVEQMRTGVWQ